MLEIKYFTFTIFSKRLLINEGFSDNLKLADITPTFKKDDKKKDDHFQICLKKVDGKGYSRLIKSFWYNKSRCTN